MSAGGGGRGARGCLVTVTLAPPLPGSPLRLLRGLREPGAPGPRLRQAAGRRAHLRLPAPPQRGQWPRPPPPPAQRGAHSAALQSPGTSRETGPGQGPWPGASSPSLSLRKWPAGLEGRGGSLPLAGAPGSALPPGVEAARSWGPGLPPTLAPPGDVLTGSGVESSEPASLPSVKGRRAERRCVRTRGRAARPPESRGCSPGVPGAQAAWEASLKGSLSRGQPASWACRPPGTQGLAQKRPALGSTRPCRTSKH